MTMQIQSTMKKYILPILGLAALVACSKTEPVYEESGEIRFAPVTSLATKAQVFNAVDGSKYPAKEWFNVTAYWKNVEAGSKFTDGTVTYFSNRTFKKGESATYWAGEPAAYWPKNGSLRFACYSPSDVQGVSHDLATDTYKVTDYVQSNNTKETVDLMVAPTPGSYNAETGAENVSVVFEHALSWISFKVVSDEDAENIFTIKKIVIDSVDTKGSLTAVMTETAKSKTWALSSANGKKGNTNVKAYDVYNNEDGVVATTTSDADEDGNPVYIENVAGGTVVIPQPTTTVTITFDQQAKDCALLENQVITLPLTVSKEVTSGTADEVAPSSWEAGKHYIYTLKFAYEEDDQILIKPSVQDWTDVPAETEDPIEVDAI